MAKHYVNIYHYVNSMWQLILVPDTLFGKVMRKLEVHKNLFITVHCSTNLNNKMDLKCCNQTKLFRITSKMYNVALVSSIKLNASQLLVHNLKTKN